MECPVCRHNSICTECSIISFCIFLSESIRAIRFIKITSIQPLICIIFSLVDCLIDKIPDKSSRHICGYCSNASVYSLKFPETVSHAMGIFTQNNRHLFIHLTIDIFIICCQTVCYKCSPVFNLLLFAKFFKFYLIRIHSAQKICTPFIVHSFIMENPCIIQLFSTLTHSHKILALAGFISKAPEENRRMIPVTQDHSLHTVNTRLRPPLITCRENPPYSMRFQICLIHQKDSIFITQFVKIWIIRIMTGANCIDI